MFRSVSFRKLGVEAPDEFDEIRMGGVGSDDA